MPPRLAAFVATFLPRHLSRQLRELYVAVAIGNLAVSAVMVFEPIYLYRNGYTIPAIAFFYIAVYVGYFFLMPIGARLALRFGYERTILASSVALVDFYLSFLGAAISPYFLMAAALCYALQKSLYWPSFYYGFSTFGKDEEEGREVGSWEALDVAVSAAGPFLGGLLLYISNFTTLFVVASVLILLSNLPLMMTTETVDREFFSYKECLERLWSVPRRRLVTSFLAFGEEVIMLVFWPLYISIVYVQDLFTLGALIASTTILTVLMLFYIGRLSDVVNKRAVLRVSSGVYATLWATRLFLHNVAGVVTIDALSRLAKKTLMVPLMSLVMQRARHRHHVMATAVLFEQSLVIGKLLALTVIVLIFTFIPEMAWQLTFLAAAGFSLLYFLL